MRVQCSWFVSFRCPWRRGSEVMWGVRGCVKRLGGVLFKSHLLKEFRYVSLKLILTKCVVRLQECKHFLEEFIVLICKRLWNISDILIFVNCVFLLISRGSSRWSAPSQHLLFTCGATPNPNIVNPDSPSEWIIKHYRRARTYLNGGQKSTGHTEEASHRRVSIDRCFDLLKEFSSSPVSQTTFLFPFSVKCACARSFREQISRRFFL